MSDKVFKTCPNCKQIWVTQDGFLADKSVELNGYKADFENLEYGLFFFTHCKDGCFSTITIEVEDFMNLYGGPYYSESKAGSEECPGYCLDIDQLDRCEARCECAFVRHVIQIINANNE